MISNIQPLATKQTEQLEKELEWLKSLVAFRVNRPDVALSLDDVAEIPSLDPSTNYGQFVESRKLRVADRLVLALAIASALKPALLADFVEKYKEPSLQLQFGGIYKERHLGFIPTFRTVLFLLAGSNEMLLQEFSKYFHSKYLLLQEEVLRIHNPAESHSQLNKAFYIDDRYLHYFLGNAYPRLDSEVDFPATLSETSLSFEDVVLPEEVKEQLEDLIKYIRNRKKLQALDEHVKGRLKSSYVVIFSGEPGTGKTITAKTIGKEFNMPVYVVNLSRIVSKYIGETEKNLERVFDRFDRQDCILFFDEADALFGKRTEVKDSKDRYANQEVAFLLQKIEAFNGVVILATNVNDTTQVFDKAFQRRIRRQIKFEFPTYAERKLLWEKSLPQPFNFEEGLVDKLAKNFQLSGANIHNIVSDAVIEALDQDTYLLKFSLLEPLLKVEFKKRGMKYEMTPDEVVSKSPQRRVGNIYRRDF